MEDCDQEFLELAEGEVEGLCDYDAYGATQANHDGFEVPIPNQAPMHTSPVRLSWHERTMARGVGLEPAQDGLHSADGFGSQQINDQKAENHVPGHENNYQFQVLDESSFIRARDSYKTRTQRQTEFPEHLGGQWGQHHYIRLLFNAMRNTEDVIDNKAFVASFLRMFPDSAIEMACWDAFVSVSLIVILDLEAKLPCIARGSGRPTVGKALSFTPQI
jgi:hypothetical protein